MLPPPWRTRTNAHCAGLGQVVSQNVETWMRQPANQQLLQRLSQAGVACVASAPAPTSMASSATATAAAAAAATTAPEKPAARGRAGPSSPTKAAAGVAEGGAGMDSGGSTAGGLKGVAGMRICVTGTLEVRAERLGVDAGC